MINPGRQEARTELSILDIGYKPSDYPERVKYSQAHCFLIIFVKNEPNCQITDVFFKIDNFNFFSVIRP